MFSLPDGVSLVSFLQHETFSWPGIPATRCLLRPVTLCNDGPSITRTHSGRVCEKRYARFIREANQEEGVR
ncbi:hypothetical protein [Methanogenium cariaci]